MPLARRYQVSQLPGHSLCVQPCNTRTRRNPARWQPHVARSPPRVMCADRRPITSPHSHPDIYPIPLHFCKSTAGPQVCALARSSFAAADFLGGTRGSNSSSGGGDGGSSDGGSSGSSGSGGRGDGEGPVVARGSWAAVVDGGEAASEGQHGGTGQQPRSQPTSQSLRADRAAWVTDEDGSELVFRLRFGQSPRVALVTLAQRKQEKENPT